jgi:hypothetical protein
MAFTKTGLGTRLGIVDPPKPEPKKAAKPPEKVKPEPKKVATGTNK